MPSLPIKNSSEVHFGSVNAPLPDWRQNDALLDEQDPDDQEMKETPPDVVSILGFDPKD
jgi:hypothetical protein